MKENFLPKTFRPSVWIGFGIVILMLAAFLAAAHLSLSRLQASTHDVVRSYQDLGNIEDINEDEAKIDSSLLGYVVKHDADSLQALKRSQNKILFDSEIVREVTSHDPAQAQRAKELRGLIDQRLAIARQTMALCDQGKWAQAAAFVRNQKGTDFSRKIFVRADYMYMTESGLLMNRDSQMARHTNTILFVMDLAGTVAFLICLAGALIIDRKIDAQARAEAVVRANEGRLFQFLEAVPVGIFILDSAGKPYYMNQAGKAIYGQGRFPQNDPEQLAELYRSFEDRTGQAYPSERLPLTRALKGERSQVEDMEIHRADKNVPLQVWGTPILDEKGKVKYAMCAFVDITERREVEELRKELISIVSHQLKTPVGEINGYVENMLEGMTGPLNEKQMGYLSDIKEIGEANFQLISDLLNVSKLERGVLSANLKPVALQEIVEMSIRDYKRKIEGKGLRFVMEGPKEEVVVQADVEKTVETVRNLINNAIKCTDQGSISVIMKKEDAYGVIEVKDTGIGMSEETQGRLFQKSRVLGKESLRSGAGIGLYIAKNFMDLQKGSISVRSQVGEGSCFTLKIPQVA